MSIKEILNSSSSTVFTASGLLDRFKLDSKFVESFKDKEPPFGFGALSHVVYMRTYSRLRPDGSKEQWYQTVERVVNGTYNMQRDWVIGNDLEWKPDKAQRSAQEMYRRIFELKFTPPGRGLWAMGSPITEERKLFAALNNCFASETEIVTNRGIKKIGDLVDKQVTLLTTGGKWVTAPIKSFGEQRLMKVVFKKHRQKKVVYATENHRWFAKSNENARLGQEFQEMTTGELGVGFTMKSVRERGIKGFIPSPQGIAQGFAFGDGAKHTHGLYVDICGSQQADMMTFFHMNSRRFDAKKDAFRVTGIPRHYMKLPDIQDSKAFLFGWLVGFFAVNGSCSFDGECFIVSNDEKDILFVRDICALLGIGYGNIHSPDRLTRVVDGQEKRGFKIVLDRNTLDDTFFVLSHHRKQFAATSRSRPSKSNEWKVLSVEITDRHEEVFCATVPKTHAFALADNILTGNCAFVSTENIDKEFSKPFRFLMDASMLGVGTGFDTKGAGKVHPVKPMGPIFTFVIPDSREGWVESVGMLLESYLEKTNDDGHVTLGRNGMRAGDRIEFDYSKIRELGAPINEFGGIASGPTPLQRLHDQLRNVMDRESENEDGISITGIVDIMNMIGVCVIAGNVRRCLPKGTLVHTNKGLIPIESIEPGMKARTASGFHPITELVEQGVQEVVTIDTQLGPVQCTERHRIAVMTKPGQYEWKRANELVSGDRMVFVEPSKETINVDITPSSPERNSERLSQKSPYVPEMILKGSVLTRAFYLAGEFDMNGSNGRPLIAASSVYPEFLKQLQAVYASLGIPTRFQKCKDAQGTWKAIYELSVVGGRAQDAFSQKIAPYSTQYEEMHKTSKSNEQLTVQGYEQLESADLNGLIPIEVYEVRRDGTCVETYDIAVQDAHEFVFGPGVLGHNTAEISFGDPSSEEYIDLKNYEKNPHRGAYGWTSNNSVFAELGMDYTDICKRVAKNGEPGFAWLHNMRHYGRMNGEEDHSDIRVAGGNPCVTGDTIVMTTEGPMRVDHLIDEPCRVVVDGFDYNCPNGFFQTGTKAVYSLKLENGSSVNVTEDHKILVAPNATASNRGETVWKEAKTIKMGEKIVLNDLTSFVKWHGTGGTFEEGSSACKIEKKIHDPSTMLMRSSDFQRGFLMGVFDKHGSVQEVSTGGGISFRLSTISMERAKMVHQMLLHFGINSKIYPEHQAEDRVTSLPDGTAAHELIITRDNLGVFAEKIGFENPKKKAKMEKAMKNMSMPFRTDPFVSKLVSFDYIDTLPVYDCNVDEVHCFGANGIVIHNCLEQSLEPFELCCLVETYPARHETREDFLRTLKFAYLYAKTVTLGRTHWKETNRVMLRNRRIGCSMSGIAQFITKRGIHNLREWCNMGYDTVQSYDKIYSEWLAIPRSIKTTSIKPSGTVSLLAGATPGVHYPLSRFYIRRIRIANTEVEICNELKRAGYPHEPCIGLEDSTTVFEFPIDCGEGVRKVQDLSVWEQVENAALMQEVWADNQVSCTVNFDPDKEGDFLPHLLDHYQYRLKGISFLPYCNAVYPQLPYEDIDEEEYNRRASELGTFRISNVAHSSDAVPERYCDGEKCEL